MTIAKSSSLLLYALISFQPFTLFSTINFFKMKKERKVWAMTLIAFWWLAPNETNAQQDSLKTLRLDEVVVTATKFPKETSETGKVLTVIDRERLTANAGKDLAQLLNEQAGIVVAGANSNLGKDKTVFLRGARNHYTLIMLDGVPLYDPSGVSGGAYDLRLLSLDQVERIEILKGSQSTLYGTDAIAGVVNIISKQEADKPLAATLQGSFGSYDTWRGHANISGSTKNLSYSAGYSRFSTDGLSEARDVNNTDTFDKDGAEQDAYQAQLNWKPITSLAIKPYVRYSTFWGRYDAGAFTDSKVNEFNADLLNLGTTIQQSWKGGSLTGLFSYDRTQRDYQSDFGPSEFEGRFQQGELFANHALTGNIQLLAGASLQHYKMIDATATEQNPTTTIASPYVSVFYHNNGLSMELGGRYNNHSEFGNNYTYSINPSYLWNRQLKLFANISTGFKAPSLYQLFGRFGANPDLKPEKSQSYEGGAEWFDTKGRYSIRAVVFRRNIQDVIIYTNQRNTNFDEQDDHGLEIEPSMTWKTLRLSAFYAYVTGEVTTTTAGVETTTSNLMRRPKHSVGANAAWQITNRLSTSVNATYFGKRDDLYYNLSTFSNTSASLDAYVLLDLYASYSFFDGRLTWFADVRNLLDQDYEESAGFSTLGINGYTGVRIKL